MKVTGIPRDDGGKDYLISHNGQQHKATRNGSLFSCNGVTDTLKAIKQKIESGELASTEDSDQEQATEDTHQNDVGLWDCVHPCALLIKLWTEPHIEFMPEGLVPEIVRTLDAYGYMLPEGGCDTQQANHDYQIGKL